MSVDARRAYVLGYARTPFGRRNGALKDRRPDDLAASTLDALVGRYGIDGASIDDVLLGNVSQVGEQGGNIARIAILLSRKLPQHVPGATVNRVCGSSQQAAAMAAQAIATREADLLIAGGVESMSRVPILSDLPAPHPRLALEGLAVHQGAGAERVAETWGITREAADAYALGSHRRALRAQDDGRFARQIVPIPADEAGPGLDRDEHPRRDTSMDALARLKPAFRPDGIITAGNSSGINDGAAALLVGSEEAAARHGLDPVARIASTTVTGSDPRLVLTGPIPATRRLLERHGLTVDDIDVFEMNEAFAPVVLAWQDELKIEPSKVNAWGGAIALGHPLGASGARLLMNAAERLHATKGSRALVTMCIGGGQGVATLLERT
jgi:acetyl-CoA acyltransferase